MVAARLGKLQRAVRQRRAVPLDIVSYDSCGAPPCSCEASTPAAHSALPVVSCCNVYDDTSGRAGGGVMHSTREVRWRALATLGEIAPSCGDGVARGARGERVGGVEADGR